MNVSKTRPVIQFLPHPAFLFPALLTYQQTLPLARSHFQDEFKIWCEEKMESCPDGVKCKKALRTLRKYKVIDIEDGKIYLRERVIGYVE